MSGSALIRLDGRPTDAARGAILAFMCVRNEVTRLPFCLAYHRRLGVSRFLVVDNASTDGTEEYLLAQPDARVWRAPGSFRESRSGTDWIESLLQAHGVGQWCLVVDADELLCYADCETRDLPALCADLDAQDRRALAAVLLDMYSDRPIRDTEYRAGQDPRDVCPYFDRRFHHARAERALPLCEGPVYFGGLRHRVFPPADPAPSPDRFYCVSKVPLVRYEPTLRVSESFHGTSGTRVATDGACLLHFKYFSSFVRQVEEECARKQHWDAAAQYGAYARALAREPGLTLFAPEESVRLRDSRQLVELGVIRDWSVRADVPRAEPVPDAPRSEDAGRVLVRQVRDMIRTQRRTGERPHELGMMLWRRDDLEGAAAAFRRAVELNPDFPWSHHSLGEVLARLGRRDAAVAAFRRAIALNPGFAMSHVRLGDLLLDGEAPDEAAACYRAALALDPRAPEAARGLARATSRRAFAMLEEARRLYRAAHALDPDDDAVYDEVLALMPLDPDFCAALGRRLAERGRSARAVFFLQLALEIRPEDPETLVDLGGALRALGESPEAMACCRRAVALAPDLGRAHGLLGDLLLDAGRADDAIAAYRRAMDARGTDPQTCKRLGDVLAGRGDTEAAGAAYARAIELGYRSF